MWQTLFLWANGKTEVIFNFIIAEDRVKVFEIVICIHIHVPQVLFCHHILTCKIVICSIFDLNISMI